MQKEISVTVPATSANLGPGFDCLGLALNLVNRTTFIELPAGLEVEVRGEGAGLIPTDETNLVIRAANTLFDRAGRHPTGLRVIQENNIPVGSGLGSSAASVLGGIQAANGLLGLPFDRETILSLAVEMEGHPDNVTPAFYGGLTLVISDGSRLVVDQIPVPDMEVVVVLPEFKLSTFEARAALPGTISLDDAIFNTSRIGMLVRALEKGNYDMLRVAMQDRLHQPYRLPLIPGMAGAFEAGLKAGAVSVALSGAGPSIIAFAPTGHRKISFALSEAFAAVGLSSRSWILTIDRRGCQIDDRGAG